MIGLIQFQESWEASRCVVVEKQTHRAIGQRGSQLSTSRVFPKGSNDTWANIRKSLLHQKAHTITHYTALLRLSWVLGMKLPWHSHVVRPNVICLECQRQIYFCTSWLLCGCLSFHCTHCWVLIGRQSSLSSDRRSGAALHCVSVSAFVHSPFQCWHQLDHFATGLLHCGRML